MAGEPLDFQPLADLGNDVFRDIELTLPSSTMNNTHGYGIGSGGAKGSAIGSPPIKKARRTPSSSSNYAAGATATARIEPTSPILPPPPPLSPAISIQSTFAPTTQAALTPTAPSWLRNRPPVSSTKTHTKKSWKCSAAFLLESISPSERDKLRGKATGGGLIVPEPGADPASLSKAEERALRSALRKIRNVASAKKSRLNQKDYIITLERDAAKHKKEKEVPPPQTSNPLSSSLFLFKNISAFPRRPLEAATQWCIACMVCLSGALRV